MPHELDRRRLLLSGLLLGAPATALAAGEFEAIERRVGGRLGLFARDHATCRTVAWRAQERFPMASTFKVLLAGVVFRRVDAGAERLDRKLRVPATVLSHSPRSSLQRGGWMTVAECCDAVVQTSDNSAANLLLDTMGGPAGFTRALRALGDPVTRLDRYELEMNEALPGDPRDTTTMAAMSTSVDRLVLGSALSPASRARLIRPMVASTTGLRRIRAGVPAGWRVADKTGTGQRGSTNDVAVIWPVRGGPLSMAVYLTGTDRPLPQREAALAAAARTAVQMLGVARG